MIVGISKYVLSKIVTPCLAQDPIRDSINAVGGTLSSTATATGFGGMAQTIANAFLPFLNFIAALVIVITGLILITSDDEDQLNKSRRVLLATIAGVMLVNVVVLGLLHGGFITGMTPGGGAAGATMISTEIAGLIRYITTPAAVVAVLVIIISGLKCIMAWGSEEGVTQLKRTVFSVVAGMIVIVAHLLIGGSFVTGDPTNLINLMVRVITRVLLFMGLAAVVVIVIAGIYMVANYGNQDLYTKARNLIIRVLIGFVVIAMAGALVLVVLNA